MISQGKYTSLPSPATTPKMFVLEIVPRLQMNKLVQSQNKNEIDFCDFLVGKFIHKKVNNQKTNTSTKS